MYSAPYRPAPQAGPDLRTAVVHGTDEAFLERLADQGCTGTTGGDLMPLSVIIRRVISAMAVRS